MSKQPEAARVERGPITEVKRFALGMADLLERQGFTIAAAELRRQHEEIKLLRERHRGDNVEYTRMLTQRDALLEALKELTGHANERFSGGVWGRARAAIKAVEENT